MAAAAFNLPNNDGASTSPSRMAVSALVSTARSIEVAIGVVAEDGIIVATLDQRQGTHLSTQPVKRRIRIRPGGRIRPPIQSGAKPDDGLLGHRQTMLGRRLLEPQIEVFGDVSQDQRGHFRPVGHHQLAKRWRRSPGQAIGAGGAIAQVPSTSGSAAAGSTMRPWR